MTATRPPFAYYGGKMRLAPKIVAHLPAHEHYVEPFAGSLAVLLAKPRAAHETVNDLDERLVTFWRVLRDRPEDLARACALTPHSRAEHALTKRAPVVDGDEIETARRIWVALSQGRTGTLRSTGWRFYRDPAGSALSMPRYLSAYVDRIPDCVERLRGVSLECRPALDVLRDYGREPDVLLYVDPPYLADVRKSRGYRYEMPASDEHRELLDALLDCRASVVLSGYASELYDEALADWRRVEIATSTGQGGTLQARTEVLWIREASRHPALFEVGA